MAAFTTNAAMFGQQCAKFIFGSQVLFKALESASAKRCTIVTVYTSAKIVILHEEHCRSSGVRPEIVTAATRLEYLQ